MDDLEDLVISPKEDKTGRSKGRAFTALRISTVMVDALWEHGSGSDKHVRPVYASFAGSAGEIQPFVTNLLCGRPAAPVNKNSYRRKGIEEGYEFLRSAGYKAIYERHDEGVVATVFLPELVDLDPGMVDPKGIKFVVTPGAAYLAAEAAKLPVSEVVAYARRLPMVEDVCEPAKDWRGHVLPGWESPLPDERLAALVPLAYLFVLYLSNRSRAPIPPDGKFYLQLLLAFLKVGIASFSKTDRYGRNEFGVNDKYGFVEEDVARGGLAPGVAFMADHEEVERVLAAECETYFKRVEGK